MKKLNRRDEAGALKMGTRLSDALVAKMHADYSSGLSLCATARNHGRKNSSSLRELFNRRGLAIRPSPIGHAPRDPKTGRIIPARRLTVAKIDALVRSAQRVEIPKVLCREWRTWPMDRRKDFIARIRARINSPADRPNTPFSPNVEPWEYGDPHVQAIVKRLNAGRNSRHKVTALKPCSQGVIWRGQIFFWVSNLPYCSGGSYQKAGPGSQVNKRGSILLHRSIWAAHSGRKVPNGFVIRFRDGNVNNLDPKNFYLQSRADEARENSRGVRLRRTRRGTAALLQRFSRNRKEDVLQRLLTTR